jgi:hypothetical protein
MATFVDTEVNNSEVDNAQLHPHSPPHRLIRGPITTAHTRAERPISMDTDIPCRTCCSASVAAQSLSDNGTATEHPVAHVDGSEYAKTKCLCLWCFPAGKDTGNG